jgi:Putative DNA-binding domain
VPSEFEVVTTTLGRSSSTPRAAFTSATLSLDIGLWKLRTLVERLDLVVDAGSDRSPAGVEDRRSPYGSRPTLELVSQAEDHYLEHKQTLLYDMRTEQANPKLEDAAMDRICGFSNAGGGTLVIGVKDRNGVVTGLVPDLKLTRDADALVNRLSQKLKNEVPSIAPMVRTTLDPVGTETVLRIDVPPGDTPLFIKERFMVRINNTTQELTGQPLLGYISSRFGPT